MLACIKFSRLIGLTVPLALTAAATAVDPPPAKQFFVPAETFEVATRPAFVMLPAKELRKTSPAPRRGFSCAGRLG